MTRFAIAVLILAVAPSARAAAPTDASAQRVEIVFRADAAVPPGLVRLGDVAEIKCGDPARVAAWKAIELFPSPAVDLPRTVQRRVIQDVIALRLGASPAADFQGATSICITTRDSSASAAAAPSAPAPARAPSQAAWRAKSDLARKLAPPEGVQVVVARRVVPSGQTITDGDVELQMASGPREEGARSVALEDVVGKETTRPIGIGQVVDPALLRLPLLVRRNEMVRIIARTAGVKVQTNGRALGDAPEGELVEVQPLGSREKILAVATGSRVVEVFTRGATAAPPETVRR